MERLGSIAALVLLGLLRGGLGFASEHSEAFKVRLLITGELTAWGRASIRELPNVGAQVLELAEGSSSDETLESLAQLGIAAEADAEIEGHARPNDPYFDRQWHLAAENGLNAAPAWDRSTGSEAIRIAVIDSGCDVEHPDLQANLWVNEGEVPSNGLDDDGNGYIDDYHGYDFLNRRGEVEDENGHGTMVFGLLAAAGDNGEGIAGVTWRSQVLCLKILGSDNQGKVSQAVEAIDYALAADVDILNLSWGYGSAAPSPALQAALQAAQDRGVLVVASAGNESRELTEGFGNYSIYPASFGGEALIAVAATDRQGILNWDSNYGSKVDLAAPGEALITTRPGGFDSFTGTSASAALVSGGAALLLAQDPSLDGRELKRRLRESASPSEALAGRIGGGMLNLPAALGSAGGKVAVPETEVDEGAPAAGGCSLRPLTSKP